MREDIYYPEYHFRPARNWMNDPNGPIFYEGRYHLFFQYNPNDDRWGNIHWGHALSPDLIHWEEWPNALYPSRDEGEEGCFSGCAVIQDSVPWIFYTSVGSGKRSPRTGAQQWSALSLDGMRSFQKRGKPAIPESLNGSHKIEEWRDPFLWREDCWYLVIGGSEEGRGCILLYRSEDLDQWEFLNVIYESDQFSMLECPNMLRLDDGHYLILYSPLGPVRYMIAELDRKDWILKPLKEGIFDHSIAENGFYAPNTYLNDPQGRLITFGWITDAERLDLDICKGWAGLMSLPRQLTVKDNELIVQPAKECQILRNEKIEDFYFDKGEAIYLRSAEISAKLKCGDNGRAVFHLFADEKGEEHTELIYDASENTLSLDRSRSSLTASLDKTKITLHPQNMQGDHKLELDIFLDCSVIEVFVNKRDTITARVYPQKEESCGISFEKTGEIACTEFNVWNLSL